MKKVTFKWEGEHFSVASCHYRKKKKIPALLHGKQGHGEHQASGPLPRAWPVRVPACGL